ncbi:hypothetical protein DBV05_g3227 [Lasiodiplodia theobromae]|uniref:Uncharacterized protein n=1 Tax=Lasiodiplodia theobromae TaxID=45133 RepID=A0A5N5DLP8_9PEZI|nr:hypothetical protein DBV05_g3227 [Lasiodiplodia theobromae]
MGTTGKAHKSDEEDRNAWTQDDDAWNAFGKRTKIRRPQEDEDDGENAYLEGEAAFQRYIECLQWLLCTQARWLVHEKGMPADLEVVIRDLWHIRLRTLSWTQNRDNTTPIRALDTLVLCYFGLVILQLPTSLHDLHSWLSFAPSSLQPAPAPTAPSSTTTTTTPSAAAAAAAATEPTTSNPSNKIDHLLYYLARDRAPPYLLHRLPGPYLNALMPALLTPARLQTGIHTLARLFRVDLGVSFPPLNFAPLAYRAYVDALALPLEALPVVEKLARGAAVAWTFVPPPGSSNSSSEGKGRGSISKMKKVDARCWLPEAQLAALVVLAMETLCPLHDIEGDGEVEGLAAAARTKKKVPAFEWDGWVRERERAAVAAVAEQGVATANAVGRANGGGDDGDEYLSAAEKMLQGHDADDLEQLPKAPKSLGEADGAHTDEDDDEGEADMLEGNERIFYEVVAKQAVMPVSLLVKTVRLVEMRLEESAKRIKEVKKRSGRVR